MRKSTTSIEQSLGVFEYVPAISFRIPRIMSRNKFTSMKGETERVTKETRILFKTIFVTSGTQILRGESNEAGR